MSFKPDLIDKVLLGIIAGCMTLLGLITIVGVWSILRVIL